MEEEQEHNKLAQEHNTVEEVESTQVAVEDNTQVVVEDNTRVVVEEDSTQAVDDVIVLEQVFQELSVADIAVALLFPEHTVEGYKVFQLEDLFDLFVGLDKLKRNKLFIKI